MSGFLYFLVVRDLHSFSKSCFFVLQQFLLTPVILNLIYVKSLLKLSLYKGPFTVCKYWCGVWWLVSTVIFYLINLIVGKQLNTYNQCFAVTNRLFL